MSRFPIFGQTAEVASAHTACSNAPRLNVLRSDSSAGLNAKFRGRAAVITLGCAKNHVDSEIMLGALENSGFEIVSEVQDADIAVVNTCGFLQSSVKESIDCILEVADLKKEGRLRKLIVAGCAVERYRGPDGGTDIRQALPEVDSFISINDLLLVGEVANLDVGQRGEDVFGLLRQGGRPYFLYDDRMPRRLATRSHTAYVKISEGCNRPCSFCIIPKIRGEMRSRELESVRKEVKDLAELGVREINLVAQDLTSYGLDLKGSPTGAGSLLAQLLQTLDADNAMRWVRLLYAYPIGVTKDLLETIVRLPSVCNYLDIPLQHSSDTLLKAMKRPLGQFAPRALVEFIQRTAPEIKLRTTFIVGFPGETDADIVDLESFISEGHFASVGIFCYSPEDGTPAGTMEKQIPEREKQARRSQLMRAQQRVNVAHLSRFIGKEIPVLIDGAHEETDLLLSGRSYFQAPEVDGSIIINETEVENSEIAPGSFVTVRVTEVAGYDLLGRVVAMQA